MSPTEMLAVIRSLLKTHTSEFSFILKLAKQYMKAPEGTRAKLRRVYHEAVRTGAIPLGYHRVENKPDREYLAAHWLIHDETRFRSDSDQLDALREMTPRGTPIEIIRI